MLSSSIQACDLGFRWDSPGFRVQCSPVVLRLATVLGVGSQRSPCNQPLPSITASVISECYDGKSRWLGFLSLQPDVMVAFCEAGLGILESRALGFCILVGGVEIPTGTLQVGSSRCSVRVLPRTAPIYCTSAGRVARPVQITYLASDCAIEFISCLQPMLGPRAPTAHSADAAAE